MSDLKPLWMLRTFHKRKGPRDGVRLIEWVDGNPRCIAKWGPYKDKQRFDKAMKEAEAMRLRLMHLWPCTFLVKGYAWRETPAHLLDPCSSTEE